MKLIVRPAGRQRLMIGLPTGLVFNRLTVEILFAVLHHYTADAVSFSMTDTHKRVLLGELRSFAARFPGVPMVEVNAHDGTQVIVYP